MACALKIQRFGVRPCWAAQGAQQLQHLDILRHLGQQLPVDAFRLTEAAASVKIEALLEKAAQISKRTTWLTTNIG